VARASKGAGRFLRHLNSDPCACRSRLLGRGVGLFQLRDDRGPARASPVAAAPARKRPAPTRAGPPSHEPLAAGEARFRPCFAPFEPVCLVAIKLLALGR
jgi:hypothetical protein